MSKQYVNLPDADNDIGIIITVIGLVDVLPDNVTPISTYPTDSITVYSFIEKATINTNRRYKDT